MMSRFSGQMSRQDNSSVMAPFMVMLNVEVGEEKRGLSIFYFFTWGLHS